LAGSFAVVPVFYMIFRGDVSRFGQGELVLPAAQVWKAVAELLAKGFGSIHPSARWAMAAGAALGIVFEWANLRTRGRFPLSGVGIGLASVVTFPDCLSMSAGALLFWFLGLRLKDKAGLGYRTFVENRETLCAGVIAGGALIGIILIMLETAL
jgi:hypothetical protein